MNNFDMARLAQRLSDERSEKIKDDDGLGSSMTALIFQCMAQLFIEAHKTEQKGE